MQTLTPADVLAFRTAARNTPPPIVIDDRNPDEILADDTSSRTAALGWLLAAALNRAGLAPGQPVRLSLGRHGLIEATDPEVERALRADPGLARRFGDVSSASTLAAMTRLYGLHAGGRSAAADRFYAAGMQLHALSGIATLQDGRLQFAVQGFADTLTALD